MRSRLIWAAVAVLLLCGAVAYAAGSRVLDGAGQERAAQERPTGKIKVRGKVRGLYPGAAKPMRVRVRNRFGHAVILRSVRVRVKDAGPGCTRRNLWVRRFRGRVPIGAHRGAGLKVLVRMSPAATDACQGARFPLRFRARVRR